MDKEMLISISGLALEEREIYYQLHPESQKRFLEVFPNLSPENKASIVQMDSEKGAAFFDLKPDDQSIFLLLDSEKARDLYLKLKEYDRAFLRKVQPDSSHGLPKETQEFFFCLKEEQRRALRESEWWDEIIALSSSKREKFLDMTTDECKIFFKDFKDRERSICLNLPHDFLALFISYPPEKRDKFFALPDPQCEQLAQLSSIELSIYFEDESAQDNKGSISQRFYNLPDREKRLVLQMTRDEWTKLLYMEAGEERDLLVEEQSTRRVHLSELEQSIQDELFTLSREQRKLILNDHWEAFKELEVEDQALLLQFEAEDIKVILELSSYEERIQLLQMEDEIIRTEILRMDSKRQQAVLLQSNIRTQKAYLRCEEEEKLQFGPFNVIEKVDITVDVDAAENSATWKIRFNLEKVDTIGPGGNIIKVYDEDVQMEEPQFSSLSEKWREAVIKIHMNLEDLYYYPIDVHWLRLRVSPHPRYTFRSHPFSFDDAREIGNFLYNDAKYYRYRWDASTIERFLDSWLDCDGKSQIKEKDTWKVLHYYNIMSSESIEAGSRTVYLLILIQRRLTYDVILQLSVVFVIELVGIGILSIPPDGNFSFRMSLSIAFLTGSGTFAVASQKSGPSSTPITLLSLYSTSPLLMQVFVVAAVLIIDKHGARRGEEPFNKLTLNQAFMWNLLTLWFFFHYMMFLILAPYRRIAVYGLCHLILVCIMIPIFIFRFPILPVFFYVIFIYLVLSIICLALIQCFSSLSGLLTSKPGLDFLPVPGCLRKYFNYLQIFLLLPFFTLPLDPRNWSRPTSHNPNDIDPDEAYTFKFTE